MSAQPARREGYHHGDLARALTDAATRMAREGGPDAVVLRAAARQAGVSAAAAYRHFADHGDLLYAVRLRAIGELADAMRQGMASGAPLADPAQEALRRFRAIGVAYVNFALEDPGLFRTAFCRPERAPAEISGLLASGGAYSLLSSHGPYSLVAGVLDELAEHGLISQRTRPLAEIALWSAVHGLATLLVDGPLALLTSVERQRAIERTLEFAAAGILAAPPVTGAA